MLGYIVLHVSIANNIVVWLTKTQRTAVSPDKEVTLKLPKQGTPVVQFSQMELLILYAILLRSN